MKLSRDNVALGYEQAGSGDPALLMIHGWGTHRGMFEPLIRATSGAHRVVAVDLRGYGESDGPIQDYSVEAYADDVAWMAGELGLEGPVILGHSLGGFVALELASRIDPRAVVILESPVAAPPTMAAAIQPAIDRLESEAYQNTAAALLDMMLGKHFDAGERARMISEVRAVPQHVLARSLRASAAFDNQKAAALVRCPVLYVGTSTPYADITRFRELCPQLVTGQLVGCGHYFPLEVPDQLNPMILRFLAVLTPPKPP
jgi:pimeloyl-ACP methyl ester carboxylesterase